MAETIIIIVILLICSLPLVIIGISQYKSKKPVGFWSGQKPPEADRIRNIAAYNKKHGIMWILFGLGIPVSFFAGMPFGEEWSCSFTTAECVGGIIGMMVYHTHLDKVYLIK